jgi:two-component system, NarL family, invasion response regulator UvrY
MINITIADPVFLVREGLKRVFEKNTNIHVREEIKSRKELWDKLTSNETDVLVVDYDYKGFLEVDELLDISNRLTDINIVVISNHGNKENILRIVKAGVLGYLTKECGSDEILRAVTSVFNGQKFFCNKILDLLLEDQYSVNKKLYKQDNLSDREIEIIKLIVEGYSNQDIAAKLFLSIHTVYTHRKNVMKKLKFKSPVELVLYALNTGIVEN